jgi:hypothetical protein
LDCGGSTPLWNEDEDKGGVEPPQSKVLRTSIFIAVTKITENRQGYVLHSE